MLEQGAENYNDTMRSAAEGGYREIVKLMLELGAENYDMVMSSAARGGHREIVKLMLEHGAENYDENLLVFSKNPFDKVEYYKRILN